MARFMVVEKSQPYVKFIGEAVGMNENSNSINLSLNGSEMNFLTHFLDDQNLPDAVDGEQFDAASLEIIQNTKDEQVNS
jgi:hypothetical protein